MRSDRVRALTERHRYCAGMTSIAGPACTVGPDYQRPAAPVPAAYKEAAGWKVGEPLDAIDRGAWWSVYKRSAARRSREARSTSRTRTSKPPRRRSSRPNGSSPRPAPAFSRPLDRMRPRSVRAAAAAPAAARASAGSGFTSNSFSTSASASWVPDLWGRVRRTVESDVASAQASAGDLASARLSAQGALASDYLQLRIADELKRLLDAAAKAYAESLRITRTSTMPASLGRRTSRRPRPSSRAPKRRRSQSA